MKNPIFLYAPGVSKFGLFLEGPTPYPLGKALIRPEFAKHHPNHDNGKLFYFRVNKFYAIICYEGPTKHEQLIKDGTLAFTLHFNESYDKLLQCTPHPELDEFSDIIKEVKISLIGLVGDLDQWAGGDIIPHICSAIILMSGSATEEAFVNANDAPIGGVRTCNDYQVVKIVNKNIETAIMRLPNKKFDVYLVIRCDNTRQIRDVMSHHRQRRLKFNALGDGVILIDARHNTPTGEYLVYNEIASIENKNKVRFSEWALQNSI